VDGFATSHSAWATVAILALPHISENILVLLIERRAKFHGPGSRCGFNNVQLRFQLAEFLNQFIGLKGIDV